MLASSIQKAAWELIHTKPFSPAHVQCTHTVAGGKRQRQFTFAAFLNTATHLFFPRSQNRRLSEP